MVGKAERFGAPHFAFGKVVRGTCLPSFFIFAVIGHIENKKTGVVTMAYRVTLHNKRIVNTRHNDRAFDTERSDEAKQAGNIYWQRGGGEIDFDGTEHTFYERNFLQALEAQNERYRKSGHAERCRSIDDYRRASQTCPEESLYYIGSKDNTVKRATLVKAFNDYMAWKRGRFPNVAALNYALHCDEAGAIHIHAREVWVAHGKDGLIVSQTKALEEMGVERPDMTKPKSRHNNAKMTYTAECRDKWIEIARSYGLEVITEPREASKSGLKLLDYQKEQAETELEALRAEIAPLEARRDKLKGVDSMLYEALEGKWNHEHTNDEPIR